MSLSCGCFVVHHIKKGYFSGDRRRTFTKPPSKQPTRTPTQPPTREIDRQTDRQRHQTQKQTHTQAMYTYGILCNEIEMPTFLFLESMDRFWRSSMSSILSLSMLIWFSNAVLLVSVVKVLSCRSSVASDEYLNVRGDRSCDGKWNETYHIRCVILFRMAVCETALVLVLNNTITC